MIRTILTLCAFASVLFFPWPFSVFLVLITASVEPLAPLAVGIFADLLYYAPHTQILPLSSLYGAGLTIIAVFVRSRLGPSIIGG